MDTSIIVACISGLLTLICTVLTVMAGNSKISQDIKAHNQVQDEKLATLDTRLNELRAEVHENNNLKTRVPILETKMEHIEEKVKNLENKLSTLTGGH